MKNKKFSNKLELKKATVVNLTDLQMQAIQGGEPFTSMDLRRCYTLCMTTVCCPVEHTNYTCPATTD